MKSYYRFLAKVGLSLSFLVGLSTAVGAQTLITATGNWEIDEKDWQCNLNRRTVSDDANGIFSVEVKPITQTYWLKLAVEGKSARRDDGKAEIFFDGSLAANDIHYNYFKASDYRVRSVMLDFARVDLAKVDKEIRIKTDGHGDLKFSATNFPAAWNAVVECRKRLHAKLLVHDDDLAKIAEPAKGNIFKSIGMPPRAKSIDFTLFYWVETDGSITDCKLLIGSGMKNYDKKMCSKLEKKGKFEPAKDANGEAVRSPVFEFVPLRIAPNVG